MEPVTIKSYKLRGTRITEAQLDAREKLWALHGIDFQTGRIDLASAFPSSSKIVMEIGFGMGEATAAIAAQNPETNYLAVEVHQPGLGKLLVRINENSLSNIKLIDRDVHEIFHYMIDDKSLDGIHLFFPDPWPKKRHHKRRIVNENFLSVVAAKVKTGGFIHIATDWVPYAISIEETFASSRLFTGGVVVRPDWRPLTRFEGQGITKDHAVTDLRYEVK
jgi:tRNA (guanine-N7-)-methyltransferase